VSSGIRLGRVGRAPIVADASAFALALVFAAAVLIDLRTSGVGLTDRSWVVAVTMGVALVGCVVLHELSHVLVATRRGLRVRAVRVYMFGGYSVIDGSPSASTEALVSLAGPVASLGLALVTWIVSSVTGADTTVGRSFLALALANLAIGAFNLVPGFPLDGGRVLRGVLAARGMDRVAATRVATRVGQWTGYVCLGAGMVLLVRATPLGLLVVATGWFLTVAATTSGRREQLSAAFDGMTVRDAMRSTPEAVPGDWTISHLLDLHALGPRLRSLPVEMDGRVVGVIGQDEVDSIAPSRWVSMRVRSLMTEIGPADVVDADEPLETLLLVPAGRTRRAVVVDDGVVVGLIEGADLAAVLPG
jgi:Zn-dependent protease